ncbi:MAG: L-histidine N(alpha)-methyltransferase [Pseudomonadota bacterium]
MVQPALAESFVFHDLQPLQGSFRADVVAGLAKPEKDLPPKYLYDSRGCELFEKICQLAEYYPTRTETAILHDSAKEIAQLAGEGCELIEYGSGSSRKTRMLLEALRPAAYIPVDIAREQLLRTSAELAGAYAGLKIAAVCADYSLPLSLPDDAGGRRKLVFFPGSTIGNFVPAEAVKFMRNAAHLAGPSGGMVVGVDLKKNASTLHAAYNDAQGVTAAFNLNLLARINRELGANFELDRFRHYAFYNAPLGRIEMHLVSARKQTVEMPGFGATFAEGESIHTENSYKYTIEEFQFLATQAGFEPARVWMDEARQFAVHYLIVR